MSSKYSQEFGYQFHFTERDSSLDLISSRNTLAYTPMVPPPVEMSDASELDDQDWDFPASYERNWLTYPLADRHLYLAQFGGACGLQPLPRHQHEDDLWSEDPSMDIQKAAQAAPSKCADEQAPASSQPKVVHECSSEEESVPEPVQSETPPAPERRRVGRRPIVTGLSQRKDVVLKTVLRKIRAFYWSRFNTLTGFGKRKKRSKPDAWFEECLKAFIREELRTEPTASQVFALGSVMSTKDMKGLISTRASSHHEAVRASKLRKLGAVDKIHAALYKFSMNRFKGLLASREISDLIIHYSEVVDREELSEDERIGLQMLLKEAKTKHK